jgi:hypothetical protein
VSKQRCRLADHWYKSHFDDDQNPSAKPSAFESKGRGRVHDRMGFHASEGGKHLSPTTTLTIR